MANAVEVHHQVVLDQVAADQVVAATMVTITAILLQLKKRKR